MIHLFVLLLLLSIPTQSITAGNQGRGTSPFDFGLSLNIGSNQPAANTLQKIPGNFPDKTRRTSLEARGTSPFEFGLSFKIDLDQPAGNTLEESSGDCSDTTGRQSAESDLFAEGDFPIKPASPKSFTSDDLALPNLPKDALQLQADLLISRYYNPNTPTIDLGRFKKIITAIRARNEIEFRTLRNKHRKEHCNDPIYTEARKTFDAVLNQGPTATIAPQAAAPASSPIEDHIELENDIEKIYQHKMKIAWVAKKHTIDHKEVVAAVKKLAKSKALQPLTDEDLHRINRREISITRLAKDRKIHYKKIVGALKKKFGKK